jgi:hypothetical protein
MDAIGNPLIAPTMLEHDLGAGLDVSVRLIVAKASRKEKIAAGSFMLSPGSRSIQFCLHFTSGKLMVES